MKIGYIYKITNPVGQFYIGRTTNLKKRIERYKSLYCKNQRLIYNSLIKYGWEKHKFEIIDEGIFMNYELDSIEMFYVSLHMSFWYENKQFGLNLTKGGSSNTGHIHNQETKDIISKKNKGRKDSEETRKRKSLSHKGLKRSEESIRKTVEGKRKHPPYIPTLEVKEKIRNSSYRKIVQIDKNGQLVKEWSGVKVASEELGIPTSSLINCCRGKYYRKTAKGYVWKYAEEYYVSLFTKTVYLNTLK